MEGHFISEETEQSIQHLKNEELSKVKIVFYLLLVTVFRFCAGRIGVFFFVHSPFLINWAVYTYLRGFDLAISIGLLIADFLYYTLRAKEKIENSIELKDGYYCMVQFQKILIEKFKNKK